MKILRPISIATSLVTSILRRLWCLALCFAGTATAQVSLAPPGGPRAGGTRPGAAKPKPKPREVPKSPKEAAKETVKKRPRNAKKPAAAPKPEAKPAPEPTVTPAPAPDDPNADYVYAAYQRGQYKTAFDLATKRVQEKGDPKAMTMLGELYANALGVKRDYDKAIDWYRRASDRAATARACSRWRCCGSPDAAARAAARKPPNCWRPRPSSAARKRRIIWRCFTSTARSCRRI